MTPAPSAEHPTRQSLVRPRVFYFITVADMLFARSAMCRASGRRRRPARGIHCRHARATREGWTAET
eukprot:3027191-Alexandrium_andersonii.AAC.1